jgi:DNA-binding NtrC family response regulator
VARTAPASSEPQGAGNGNGGDAGSDGLVRLDQHRKKADREALENALHRARGNRALAARLLGVSRRTLYNKLAELGLR